MQQEEITAIFDQQAASYDDKWSSRAPCSRRFPSRPIFFAWARERVPKFSISPAVSGMGFTAVEPSAPMLAVFRRRADEQGISARCVFHAGYLDSLPPGEVSDAATAFLVSQFILDRELRAKFFRSIAERLRPEGLLVCSDLAGDLAAAESQSLFEVWFQLMKGGGISPLEIARMREAYTRDVAVLPPSEVATLSCAEDLTCRCTSSRPG